MSASEDRSSEPSTKTDAIESDEQLARRVTALEAALEHERKRRRQLEERVQKHDDRYGLILEDILVLYVRRQAALALLRSLPDAFTLSFEEFTYVIEVGEVKSVAARWLTRTAFAIAKGMPVILAKLTVFVFVVFALLYRGDRHHRHAPTG